MTHLRPYQRAAIDACMSYWEGGGGNPLIDLATGTGKSVVLGTLVREIAEPMPDVNVLVLTHVKELVQQDVNAQLRVWPACPIGINSAGLSRRDRRARVLFASIQSVHREDATTLGPRHLCIVDEAHLIPRDGNGMYLKLFNKLREAVPDMRIVGLTATPYRLDSGRLDEGEHRLFDDVVYSYGIGEGVQDGFLSPLVSRNGGAGQIDARGVAKRGGEFIPGALETAANTDPLVQAACRDLVNRGCDRRGWIVFCTGVNHATHVAECLHGMGVATGCITGETPGGERDAMLRAFKAGQLRCLTSVGVLTTGFDAPHVDLIAMLRPTLSTGLYVQMLGRGTRLAPGKENCLVLDYAGNVRRHGPVDAVSVTGAGGKSSKDETKVKEETVRAKECPSCGSLVGLRVMTCADCGHEWPVEKKHEAKADTGASVMVREVEDQWHPVQRVEAHVHQKRGGEGPATLRIEYWSGITCHREWICLDHSGFVGDKARLWWRRMTGQSSAEGISVELAAQELQEGLSVIDCKAVRIKRDGKFWRVSDRLLSNGIALNDKLQPRPVEAEARAA
jgi:DNA repair protein RadD